MIRSFRDKETERIFRREFSRQLQGVAHPASEEPRTTWPRTGSSLTWSRASRGPSAKRKLDQTHAATALSDLGAVPGNRLETLSGKRTGQHSIRINDQWRICFHWIEPDAMDVEIVDYH